MVINKLNWETPLVYACNKGKVDAVYLMIENYSDWGVDCKACNGSGKNVLMVAMENGYVDCVRLLVSKAGEMNLNLNAHDLDENTALMIGCIAKRPNVIQVLMDLDRSNLIDWNRLNKSSNTPFILACQPTHNEVKDARMAETVLLLMKHSRSLNINLRARDESGRSGLDYMTTTVRDEVQLTYPELFDSLCD